MQRVCQDFSQLSNFIHFIEAFFFFLFFLVTRRQRVQKSKKQEYIDAATLSTTSLLFVSVSSEGDFFQCGLFPADVLELMFVLLNGVKVLMTYLLCPTLLKTSWSQQRAAHTTVVSDLYHQSPGKLKFAGPQVQRMPAPQTSTLSHWILLWLYKNMEVRPLSIAQVRRVLKRCSCRLETKPFQRKGPEIMLPTLGCWKNGMLTPSAE